jgi:hypothetical protein
VVNPPFLYEFRWGQRTQFWPLYPRLQEFSEEIGQAIIWYPTMGKDLGDIPVPTQLIELR